MSSLRLCPVKGLAGRKNQCKGGNKSKQRKVAMATAVAAGGSFVLEQFVIWRSKVPRSFKSLNDQAGPTFVHYFSNKKTWRNSDIMEIRS